MAAASREAAIAALLNLIEGAYPWKFGPMRRLKLWGDVPGMSRPACFLFEGGQESYSWTQSAAPIRTMEIKIFIYLNAKPADINGSALVNEIMDELDAAFAPAGSDIALGRQTLGGVVHHCRIDGKPLKDPGDLDGDALLIVPVKIVLGA